MLKVLLNIRRTFCSPAPGFYDPSDETLSLLSLPPLVRALNHTDSTHHTVLPATLTHQDLLHCVFIQHNLCSAKQISNNYDCQDMSEKSSSDAMK